MKLINPLRYILLIYLFSQAFDLIRMCDMCMCVSVCLDFGLTTMLRAWKQNKQTAMFFKLNNV